MAGLYERIENELLKTPARAIIEAGSQSYSGAALVEGVEQAATALDAAGVRKGDRVLVQAEKSVSLVLLYLATLRQGGVYVPLNTAYREKEFEYFLGDAEPKLVVCTPENAAGYQPLASVKGATVLTLGADGQGTFTELSLSAQGSVARPTIEETQDLAAIVYTSGTTGRSKGAMLTHANLARNAAALQAIWSVSSDDMLLHALPLFHIHGLFIALNTLLISGGRLRMLDRFDAGGVVKALPGCTLFMGVPTYYGRLLHEANFTRETTRNVRLCISGSAPLSLETYDAFQARTGQAIVERYGMSECGIICANRPDGPPKRGFVGYPIAGATVRIADEAGGALPHGEVGGLEVRGDSVFRGYWRMPEKTKAEFREDGFFITGDLGRMDGDGCVELVGRAKDMVISGGLNVYPSEVEAVIEAYPGVEECAVFGVPHPDFGEAVVAMVCPKAGAAPDADALTRHLRTELASFKTPKTVFIESTLPRNAMGKVEKAVLRTRFADLFKESVI